MDNVTVFEFFIGPQPKPDGTSAAMAIRIEVKEGNRVVVSGVSGDEEYDGKLLLRKRGNPFTKSTDEIAHVDIDTAPGGDQCYIDGRWYNPCPIKDSNPG